jgi:hypothetical protein
MNTLEELKQSIEGFSAVQIKYGKYGASDSEPTWAFEQLMVDTIRGEEDVKIPTEAGWHLYSSSMDCTEAAGALHEAAKKVLADLNAASTADAREAVGYFVGD